MNKTYKKIISFFLIVTCLHLIVVFGMAKESHASDTKYKTYSGDSFEPEFYYLKKHDGRYKVRGTDIERRGNIISIKTRNGTLESVHRIQDIKQITVVGRKKGSYALPGLGIGALAGGLVGGLGVGLSGDCSNAGDVGDCKGMHTLGTILISAGGAVIGGLIGLGVGSAIPKRPKVKISPMVVPEAKQTQIGVGLTTSF